MSYPRLDHIEKRDLSHVILKPLLNLAHRMWYRSITIEGREHITKGKPVIYAPNHRNALMDDLAILFHIPDQPVYLSRADIHKKRFISRILTYFKIMPVYRMRDGMREVSKNEQVFNKTSEVLQAGVPIVIFPEGNHGDPRRIRQLKKGISRIAFQAEADSGYELGLHIIPVGIDFEERRFQSRLTVSFGQYIAVSEYLDDYRENAVKGIIRLQDRVKQELQALTIHIPYEEEYKETLGMVLLFTRLKVPVPGRYNNGRILTRALVGIRENNPALWRSLVEKYRATKDEASDLGMDMYQRKGMMSRFLGPLVSMLLALFGAIPAMYGAINNILAVWLAFRMTKLFKDPQFISTARFGTGLFMVPFLYLGQAAIAWHLTSSWWIAVIYLVTLPLSLIFAYRYLKFIRHRFWFSIRVLFQPGYYTRAMAFYDRRSELLNILDEWLIRQRSVV